MKKAHDDYVIADKEKEGREDESLIPSAKENRARGNVQKESGRERSGNGNGMGGSEGGGRRNSGRGDNGDTGDVEMESGVDYLDDGRKEDAPFDISLPEDEFGGMERILLDEKRSEERTGESEREVEDYLVRGVSAGRERVGEGARGVSFSRHSMEEEEEENEGGAPESLLSSSFNAAAEEMLSIPQSLLPRQLSESSVRRENGVEEEVVSVPLLQ